MRAVEKPRAEGILLMKHIMRLGGNRLFGVWITNCGKVGSVPIIHNYSGNMRISSDGNGYPQYPWQGIGILLIDINCSVVTAHQVKHLSLSERILYAFPYHPVHHTNTHTHAKSQGFSYCAHHLSPEGSGYLAYRKHSISTWWMNECQAFSSCFIKRRRW